MSKDFDKSDFDKSDSDTPSTKSKDQLNEELMAKIFKMTLQRLDDFDMKQLIELIVNDNDILNEIKLFSSFLLGGDLSILHSRADKLEAISGARRYLGAEKSAEVCDAVREALYEIMDDVGAKRS